jgi:hypothetical protein
VEGLEKTAKDFREQLSTVELSFEGISGDDPDADVDRDALQQALAAAVVERLRPVLDEYRTRAAQMARDAQAAHRKNVATIQRVRDIARQLDEKMPPAA